MPDGPAVSFVKSLGLDSPDTFVGPRLPPDRIAVAASHAQTIGASRVGERYVPTDAPLDLWGAAKRYVLGAEGRPATVAAADPYGIDAWLKGAGPMPMLMGATKDVSAAEALAAKFPRTTAAIRAYKGGYPYDAAGNPITEFKSVGVRMKGVFEQYVGKKGGFAGFFSDNPDVASRFAGPQGAVHAVDIEPFHNPLVIDAKGSHSANLQYADMAKQPHEKAALMELWDTLRGKNVGEYDGVVLKNTADEGTVYIPMHPDRVTSAFAKAPEGSK